WRSIKVKEFQRSFRHSDTERLSRSNEVLKLKNFKKDATLKLFKSTNQERYEHVGPEVTSLQDGKLGKSWYFAGESSLRRSMGGQRGTAVPSLLQTNCRQIILLRGKSNPQPDFVEIPSSGFGERYNVRSFCRSHGRKRARNLKSFGDTVEVDDVILEDVDRGGIAYLFLIK
ncbi:hypothetical protein Tco_0718858, partial [Tanacetum coccineum]